MAEDDVQQSPGENDGRKIKVCLYASFVLMAVFAIAGLMREGYEQIKPKEQPSVVVEDSAPEVVFEAIRKGEKFILNFNSYANDYGRSNGKSKKALSLMTGILEERKLEKKNLKEMANSSDPVEEMQRWLRSNSEECQEECLKENGRLYVRLVGLERYDALAEFLINFIKEKIGTKDQAEEQLKNILDRFDAFVANATQIIGKDAGLFWRKRVLARTPGVTKYCLRAPLTPPPCISTIFSSIPDSPTTLPTAIPRLLQMSLILSHGSPCS
ncbi:hypothetical protein L596_023927 [Steinernema carpocapsae]|nr:hypothetical protein L596_023927 [Steinernema carpocapsae]